LGLCLILASTVCVASQEVRLASGQILEVESFRQEGDAVILVFEGGGTLAVRSGHVVSMGGQVAPKPGVLAELKPPAGPELAPAQAAALPEGEPTAVEQLIGRLAERYEVPPLLVAAVIQVESMWDADAVSSKGAMGLMQLMPATAKGHGVTDPFDPAQNVEAGIAELAVQLRKHENEISMALAAYNAGGVAVKRYQGIPPYRETIDYVKKVLDLYFSWTEQDLRGEAVDAGPPSGRAGR